MSPSNSLEIISPIERRKLFPPLNPYFSLQFFQKNRKNIVISRNAQYPFDNLIVVPSLNNALEYYSEGDIYIAGGYNLFKEAIDIVDKMYLTEIDLFIENGDVFFPTFQEEDFNVQLLEENHDTIPYKRLVYSRKK